MRGKILDKLVVLGCLGHILVMSTSSLWAQVAAKTALASCQHISNAYIIMLHWGVTYASYTWRRRKFNIQAGELCK